MGTYAGHIGYRPLHVLCGWKEYSRRGAKGTKREMTGYKNKAICCSFRIGNVEIFMPNSDRVAMIVLEQQLF